MIRYMTLPEDPSSAEKRLLALMILLSVAAAGRRKELSSQAAPAPEFIEEHMKEAYCAGARQALSMIVNGYDVEEILAGIERFECTPQ